MSIFKTCLFLQKIDGACLFSCLFFVSIRAYSCLFVSNIYSRVYLHSIVSISCLFRVYSCLFRVYSCLFSAVSIRVYSCLFCLLWFASLPLALLGSALLFLICLHCTEHCFDLLCFAMLCSAEMCCELLRVVLLCCDPAST